MPDAPTTVAFPRELPARRSGRGAWTVDVDGVEVSLSNLDKPFWDREGYTKADLVAYYYNVAPVILPYLVGRPLTLKRMPDGAGGDFFYAKQAPDYTPTWMRTVAVTSMEDGKRIDYLVASDTAGLLWLANLGCIEMHPWHSRVDALGRPDYAFFDLDPFGGIGFEEVREVALLIRTAVDRLGLRCYPRTSGATGMQVYVPLDRVHSSSQVREWVGRVCRLVNRADPGRTTMQWDVARRGRAVFLDHNMNTEGRNIAATWSLRPEPQAPVATPLRWEEVSGGVVPQDFTIASVWERLDERGDDFAPVLSGGQDLRASMEALGMPVTAPEPARHQAAVPAGDLSAYGARRDFARTPEPPADPSESRAGDKTSDASRFVIQHHLATRLHHDLRLEEGGTARSWAVPKGLPDTPGVRHLAIQTEDHPLSYLDFEGEIPTGEYGGGPVRIWDRGTYEALEWRPDKVTFRLEGRRHQGVWHLFRTGGGDDRQWMVTRRAPAEDPVADPPQLTPMLAHAVDEPFDDPEWLFEVKWDGVRALATTRRPAGDRDGSTTLVSRAGNDITAAYPEVAGLWQRLLARNAVLDGELVALGPAGVPSFERLQQRMHLRDQQAVARAGRETPVTYMVFDLLAIDGVTLTDLPLDERLRRLDDVLVPGGAVARSAAVPEQGCDLHAAVAARGMEGIIAKRTQSAYRPGRRSRDWLKIKTRHRLACVIGGWLPLHAGTPGRRHTEGAPLASLLIGRWQGDRLRLLGRVGTGFDEAERRRLAGLLEPLRSQASPFTADDLPAEARWVRPELVCTVEYAERTAGGRLRAPSYKGLVPEADPRRCRDGD